VNEKRSGKDLDHDGCVCPFCDAPMKDVYPFCKDCGKELHRCKVCGKPIPPHMDLCGDCRS
jgi:predicted amidophosphoribosyltransferase